MTVRKESKEIIVLRVGMTLIVLFREYVYVYASVSRVPGRVGALNDKGYDRMGVPTCLSPRHNAPAWPKPDEPESLVVADVADGPCYKDVVWDFEVVPLHPDTESARE